MRRGVVQFVEGALRQLQEVSGLGLPKSVCFDGNLQVKGGLAGLQHHRQHVPPLHPMRTGHKP